jgi:hypothetical protein
MMRISYSPQVLVDSALFVSMGQIALLEDRSSFEEVVSVLIARLRASRGDASGKDGRALLTILQVRICLYWHIALSHSQSRLTPHAHTHTDTIPGTTTSLVGPLSRKRALPPTGMQPHAPTTFLFTRPLLHPQLSLPPCSHPRFNVFQAL